MTKKALDALEEIIRQATSADRIITVEDENKLIEAEETLLAALQAQEVAGVEVVTMQEFMKRTDCMGFLSRDPITREFPKGVKIVKGE